MLFYQASDANEYLAITGMGIKDVHVKKSSFVLPLQRCVRFSVQPQDYAMDMLVMTKEKLQISLPVVFTIGPDITNRGDDAAGDALLKYAMLLSGSDEGQRNHIGRIVRGIVEGETRVLISSMSIDEVFTKREEFKKKIFGIIQGELDQFGLKIWNANVKELKDAPGSTFFADLARKAHEGATNQARIDVAEAQRNGTVGEADLKGKQEREIAKIDADTAVNKTQLEIERARAEAHLKTENTALDRDVDIAKVTAQRSLESRDEELKKEVEGKRAQAELARLRARDVVKATIARESAQQAADAEAYKVSADAGAQKKAQEADADAAVYRIRAEADAAAYAAQKSAEADVLRRTKEAEGIAAMADAYAKMAGAFGGPSGLLQYLMIEKGTYVELAKANAAAIRGLEPKISVWNTGSGAAAGSGGGGGADATETMRNVYQMLPPLMTTINEQTGITLPEWQFGKLNAAQQALQNEQSKTKAIHQ
ncbi:Band 7 protein [Cordyceps fumosorosea ARSEF 2679]|uniref:Band 7 protein n=1 Tax=Cordyceps fumosorosea (strain ARSEF 2679) TaxID=1081104 RepID=A0A168BBM8_CORFA|nr:Band 7 protein [Cordyceps fumosorosea ARSEF 2679]OAA69895.1 Band 7 protein [Cordyceps fumosorosea ARSEF 2679]